MTRRSINFTSGGAGEANRQSPDTNFSKQLNWEGPCCPDAGDHCADIKKPEPEIQIRVFSGVTHAVRNSSTLRRTARPDGNLSRQIGAKLSQSGRRLLRPGPLSPGSDHDAPAAVRFAAHGPRNRGTVTWLLYCHHGRAGSCGSDHHFHA